MLHNIMLLNREANTKLIKESAMFGSSGVGGGTLLKLEPTPCAYPVEAV